jgi:H+/Cl- antiporter ClcA/CBS domain-containing protein
MIHVAALIANVIVFQWASREGAMVRRRLLSELYLSSSDGTKFVFTSAGVAAGVGASFRCPLAGVMFAFEGFSCFWSQETASMCMLASGVASCVAWYLAGTNPKGAWYLASFEDTSGTFEPQTIRIIPAAFARVSYPSIQILEFWMLLLLGALGGLWGSLFSIFNGFWLARWRKAHMVGARMRQKRLAEIVIVATISSVVCVLVPALWPCRLRTQQEESALAEKGQRLSWRSSTCPSNFVNEMATLTFQGHGTTMNNLFAESDDMQFSAETLLTYGAIYFVVTLVSVGTATPAGAVMPMVLVGASWGRGLGVLTRGVFDYEGNLHPHPRFYAVLGGAAALAGFFRLPLAVTAMTVEVTGNSVFTAPLLICCTIARVIADRIAPAFIETRCMLNDYPLLKQEPPPTFWDRTAFDIMAELDKGVAYAPHMISEVDNADRALWLLDTTRHNAFPVVKDRNMDWTLVGLVERNALASAVEASQDDNERFVEELTAAIQVSPPTVTENMPADRVYAWFMGSGLRRIVVVKDGSLEVTGIITRHDLHEAVIQWKA